MISLYMHFMAKSFLAFYINILKNSFSLPPRRLAIKHTFTSKLNSKDRHITRRQTSCRRGQGDSNWMFKLAIVSLIFYYQSINQHIKPTKTGNLLIHIEAPHWKVISVLTLQCKQQWYTQRIGWHSRLYMNCSFKNCKSLCTCFFPYTWTQSKTWSSIFIFNISVVFFHFAHD